MDNPSGPNHEQVGAFGRYEIKLDREWLLTELAEFPDLYVQVYAFFAQVESQSNEIDSAQSDRGGIVSAASEVFEVVDDVRISHGRRINYPWAGGWSSTNFYRRLVGSLYGEAVPRVTEIRYSSPGFIALGLWLSAAAAVRRCINKTAETVSIVHKTYHEIYRGMHDRKLLAIDVRRKRLELTKDELTFVIEARKSLGEVIGLSPEQLSSATILGPGTTVVAQVENELGAVKVLLSLLRRVMRLSEFQEEGKAKF